MPSHVLLVRNSHAQWIGLATEIIAEAEIAQHLEERVVIGGAADVVDVAGAQAFLAGGGPGEIELATCPESGP